MNNDSSRHPRFNVKYVLLNIGILNCGMALTVDVGDISSYEYNTLIFYVNGHRIEEDRIDPKTTLATYLRDHC
ncbi:Alternative oxidase, mitochondrial precursor [Parelaphostrongylus tenuis]|uniref:Alternative oxidase, mitochondrial n=1 Tax=Parelaphostrongylus tenuis TaxID=148309 RepID=A0AAD5WFE7_PARTN|nr:Alternative oxidase, mitochondrial precursor [Parelaphostrongylus tenuis]